MAKDVITRFKLETTQYDSALREKAKELTNFTKTATQAGKGFTEFTRANVEAVRALGNTASGATNLKDKLKDTVNAFNSVAKAYNQLTGTQKQSDFGKAMSESLQKLQQNIHNYKSELEGLGKSSGGGLLSGMFGDVSKQVLGGNLMTKGVAMAGNALASFAGEIKDCITQGIELAKQGEGIRIAFERLGRGDILEGLREATHGTVSDIELMKAAVKFNDFQLPIEELGTMLAFAQQKAKDTGQSVDYMVDSIVTGLGRKSLMILDNLGLSAAEIRDRMKETGDMTSAVGAIIREQMSKAGDYVETAADRALQSNVSLQNKMEELGRKWAPLEEASSRLWTSMKTGILDVIGGPLAELLNGLTDAGRKINAMNKVNGNDGSGTTLAQRRLEVLSKYSGSQKGVTKSTIYNRQMSRYTKEEEDAWRKVNEYTAELKELQKGVQSEAAQSVGKSLERLIEKYTNIANAIRASKAEYQKGAQSILGSGSSAGIPTLPDVGSGGGSGSGGGGNKINTTQPIVINAPGIISADTADKGLDNIYGFSNFQQNWQKEKAGMSNDELWKMVTGEDYDRGEGADLTRHIRTGKDEKKDKKGTEKVADAIEDLSTAVGGVTQTLNGLEQLGLEIPEGIQDAINVIQALTSIIQGVNTVISVFSTGSQAANTASVVANTTAIGLLTTAVWANTGGKLLGLNTGGVVKAASGVIAGQSYKSDRLAIAVNSGEMVINEADQKKLFDAIHGDALSIGMGGTRAIVKGEDIHIVTTNYRRRSRL